MKKNKVYQLAFWPDDKRAMPGDFIACALFSALQEKDAEYLERVQLASINGLSVTYTGHRLTQVHADVWDAIMHLARQFPEGSRVEFRARQLHLQQCGHHHHRGNRAAGPAFLPIPCQRYPPQQAAVTRVNPRAASADL